MWKNDNREKITFVIRKKELRLWLIYPLSPINHNVIILFINIYNNYEFLIIFDEIITSKNLINSFKK